MSIFYLEMKCPLPEAYFIDIELNCECVSRSMFIPLSFERLENSSAWRVGSLVEGRGSQLHQ